MANELGKTYTEQMLLQFINEADISVVSAFSKDVRYIGSEARLVEFRGHFVFGFVEPIWNLIWKCKQRDFDQKAPYLLDFGLATPELIYGAVFVKGGTVARVPDVERVLRGMTYRTDVTQATLWPKDFSHRLFDTYGLEPRDLPLNRGDRRL